jgi:hypothetical protein
VILAVLLISLACLGLFLLSSVHAATITLTSDPDCVSWGPDRIDCVARGPDNALWHNAWMGRQGWNGWESFGGTLTSGPSISSWGPNRLDMFAKGSDNALWHIMWDGTLHQWESLHGLLTSDPDCTSAATNMIDCFVKGPDNALWQIAFTNGAWSSWKSIGGVLASGPGAASVLTSTGERALRVFVKGMDNALWDVSWFGPSSGWGQWENLGGILTSDPDALHSFNPQEINNPQSSSHRFDIVVKGPDNGIWWKWWRANVGWSTGCQGCDGYEKLGGLSNSGPTVVSRAWNSLDAFALGMDNHLYHRSWDGTAWSPVEPVPMDMAVTSTTTNTSISSTASSSMTSSSSTHESSTQTSSTETGVASTTTTAGIPSFLVASVAVVIVLALAVLLLLRRKRASN